MHSMKSIPLIFSLLIALALQVSTAHAELNVVTTTEDIASLVKEIGKDHISVSSITKGYQDAHFVQAKPSYMVKTNKADLLVYMGLELEIGWLGLIIDGSRNPNIKLGQPGHLNLSSAITPIEVPTGEIDRSMGDIHPEGNPHYHLDPANGLLMANSIANRLAVLDPANATAYKANLADFRRRLEAKINEWDSRMKKFKGTKVVTYHTTWSYFLKHFGLEYAGTVELKPGVPPTPKHLAQLVDVMQRLNTKVIINENYTDANFSNLVGQKTGSKVLVLPVSVGGVPEVTDYIGLFDYLVTKMEKALSN